MTRSSGPSRLCHLALLTLSLPLVALTGCAEEGLPQLSGPTLPIEDSTFTLPPSEASASNPEGHWSREQRGVAMDKEDVLLLRSKGAEVNEALGTLTLNLPLLSLQSNVACLEEGAAEEREPLAQLNQTLSALRDAGLSPERVVVTVELLTPKQNSLYHVCLNGGEPRFFTPAHRAHVLSTLRELAASSEVSAVTLGASLNSYYHLTDPMSGFEYRWDYPNLVSLYHETYSAMKEVNPELLVGPGLSWGTLINTTTPRVAEELELNLDEQAEADLALEVALRRSVWSLLTTREGELRADFVGVSLRPNTVEAPFNGNADTDVATLEAYYSELALLGTPINPINSDPLEVLPLAFTQLDWTSPNGANANLKGVFLTGLKVALRHVNPLWVSWLRLSDLPKLPAESSICKIYTSAPKNYPESFCFAALFDANGQPRDAWEVFSTDPTP